jgi:hypothetical protein
MTSFKKNFGSLIEKYNGSSWSWIPNQFKDDFLEATEDTQIHPESRLQTSASELEKDKEVFDAFLELEQEIKNPLFFWTIIYPVYKKTTFSQVYLNKFISAFSRQDRLSVQLKNRQECMKRMFDLTCKVVGKRIHPKERAVNNKINKRIKKNKNLILYRGFSIRKDEDVRVGRYKIDNPKAEEQDAGLGLSYTIDRKCANFFATQFKIEKGIFPFGKVKLKWSETGKTKDIPNYVDESLIDENSRRVVASYSIKKDDILFYSATMMESEVVVLPDKAKLIRYDFLNPNDVHRHPIAIANYSESV